MKTIITFLSGIILILGGTEVLHAQSSVNTSGGNATGPGGSASYSIGQVDNITATGNSGTASQGVQQPYEFFVVGIDNFENISLEISAYPNPTSAHLNLKIENQDTWNLSYHLLDQKGAVLLSQNLIGHLTTIPMQELSSAIYILKVYESNKEIKSFKIIKK